MVARCSHKAAEIQTQNTKLFHPEGKLWPRVSFAFCFQQNEPFESIRDNVLKSFIRSTGLFDCWWNTLALWRWIISSFCHLQPERHGADKFGAKFWNYFHVLASHWNENEFAFVKCREFHQKVFLSARHSVSAVNIATLPTGYLAGKFAACCSFEFNFKFCRMMTGRSAGVRPDTQRRCKRHRAAAVVLFPRLQHPGRWDVHVQHHQHGERQKPLQQRSFCRFHSNAFSLVEVVPLVMCAWNLHQLVAANTLHTLSFRFVTIGRSVWPSSAENRIPLGINAIYRRLPSFLLLWPNTWPGRFALKRLEKALFESFILMCSLIKFDKMEPSYWNFLLVDRYAAGDVFGPPGSGHGPSDVGTIRHGHLLLPQRVPESCGIQPQQHSEQQKEEESQVVHDAVVQHHLPVQLRRLLLGLPLPLHLHSAAG